MVADPGVGLVQNVPGKPRRLYAAETFSPRTAEDPGSCRGVSEAKARSSSAAPGMSKHFGMPPTSWDKHLV